MTCWLCKTVLRTTACLHIRNVANSVCHKDHSFAHGGATMAFTSSRRTLLKYTRNLLYALPFGSALLSAGGNLVYGAEADEQAYSWKSVATGGGGGFIVDI